MIGYGFYLRLVLLLTTLFVAPLHASFQSGANELINQVSPEMNIGVEVVDLTTGAILYRRSHTKTFIPASNMKLFSNAAALMILGPDYRFKNQLSTNATLLQNGVLKGSLYLHLSGDPSFNKDRLKDLLSGLKKWHISKIQGNIFIDSSHAEISAYPPGWVKKDLIYSYGAPLSPVMIDANRLIVTVNPADKVNKLAIIEVADPSGTVLVKNYAITKDSSQHCGLGMSMDANNQISVHGCIGIGQRALLQGMAIRAPLLYAAGLIKHELHDVDILLEGSVLLGKSPPGSLLIASETSKPIAQLLADTLKPSDNLYADSLFLHAAEKLNGSPVNWDKAQFLLKSFLQEQTGIPLNNAILTDGSGLSRKSLVTPEQTVNLLRFLYERFPLTYEYITALPVAGRDGTMQNRFKKPNQKDLVRAKTGTMTGIMSLSGYLYTINSHTLAFTIFINRLPKTTAAVAGKSRYLIDALCNYFLQQKPSDHPWSRIFAKHPLLKFQLNPTQAEITRKKQAKWRNFESSVKQALRGQAVSVIYHNNELVLYDNETSMNKVFHSLQALRSSRNFAVILADNAIANENANWILWTQTPNIANTITEAQRIWTLRDAIT